MQGGWQGGLGLGLGLVGNGIMNMQREVAKKEAFDYPKKKKNNTRIFFVAGRIVTRE